MSSPALSSPRQASTPEQVFREYAPHVYRLALDILGNDAHAEEVASEVLLQAMREPDKVWDQSWLDRLSTNAARKCQRAQPVQDGPSQEGLVSALARATALLPAMYREVIVLVDSVGLSYAAVAKQLGLSLAEVDRRLHHARLLLRQALATPKV